MTDQPTPTANAPVGGDIGLAELQSVIRATYGERDRRRGVDGNFGWFIEEVGELSRALRRQGHDERVEEFSDVLAWLLSLADLVDVDMAVAAARYRDGCPKCASIPCTCHAGDRGDSGDQAG